MMLSWISDLRQAVRVLSKHQSFALMAIATLALAIGANTAVFSVTRAVLLDPLPYRDAKQLVMLWEEATAIGFPTNTVAPGNYADWKSQSSVFDGMAALGSRSYTLTGQGEPERLQARQVTYDFFSVLGVAPILGRPFTRAEDQPESPKVAVLGSDLWKTRFGARQDIIGSQVLLDGEPHTIVGVMPPGFDFPSKGTQLWTPIAFAQEQLQNHGSHILRVVARLKPGVSQEQAQQQMDTIARRLQQDYPATNAKTGVLVTALRDNIIGKTGTAVLLLLAIAGCVLLIASANLANILLARSVSRRREIGIRIALGAGRARLIRQLFAENIILSMVGVVFGLALAEASLEFLSLLIPADLTSARLALDGRMLLFTLLLGMLTTLLFGAVPVRQAWRLGVVETIGQGGSRSGEQRSTHRMRSWLVVSQTAFTFVLLVAGGLMFRTFGNLRAIDPGFRGEQVLTMRTTLTQRRYRGLAPRAAFYSQVLERVRALPGVIDAGYTSWIPYMNFGGASSFDIEGRPEPPRGQDNDSNIRLVTPGYMTALGMKLLAGRLLTAADHAGTEPVSVINQTMAEKYWPGEDPLNHRVRTCRDCPWFRIVGIVGDIHQWALDIDVRPEQYVPFDQLPQALQFAAPQDLAIRTAADPETLEPAVRRAIRDVDPQQPVAQVRVLADYLDADLAPHRFQTQLMGAFAVLALVLASLGIYGVLSYSVSQRRREIGVRMALGADRGDVLRLVTAQGLRPALAGLAIGFIAAYGLSYLISELLHGVGSHDPITFGIAAAILLSTALLACWIPARRASRVEPATVLHYE
jgi:putative ABC transport system permease protein